MCRGHIWDTIRCFDHITKYVVAVKDPKQKEVVSEIIRRFKTETLPSMETQLVKSFIHGDTNDQNLLIDDLDSVIGVIDFDDIGWSYPIVELAITAAYVSMVSEVGSIIAKLRLACQGFESARKVSEIEKSLLYSTCLMRFAQSICAGNYHQEMVDPDNEYLMQHSDARWRTLEFLLALGEDEFVKLILH